MKTDSDGGAMKVKAITGSLNSARNPAVYIQNFTVLAFNPVEIVDAGAEMSFEYLFKVDSGVDLQPSQLALTVFYEGLDEDGAPVDFTSTFFNETVMLHEDHKSFLLVDVIGTYAITVWHASMFAAPTIFCVAVRSCFCEKTFFHELKLWIW